MTTDTRRHRGGDPQRLMNSHKVVVHVKNCQCRDVVLNLLAERIREPSEAAH